MHLSLDTHSYDGHVGPIYHQLVKQDQTPSTELKTFMESITLLKLWTDQSKIVNKKHIIKAIHLLEHDTTNNFDRDNQIHVEELLPRVIHVVKCFDPCGIDLFLHNIGEISELGSCAQGRTTRLLGFYIPYVC
jgi:hypothetical protein